MIPTRFLCAFAFALFFVGMLERDAFAFPWMIRHDYKVCNSCHADPSGAGLLTMYGRGMEETLVRSYYGKHTGEEDPGTLGNFMFGAFDSHDPNKPSTWEEHLLLQVDGRGLNYLQFSGNAPALDKVYLMQANAAGQVTFGRFRANGDLGLGAPGDALASSITRGDYRLISRQHWVGVDLGSDNQFLLRAGRMNLPFGLRNIEHTSFVRATTRTDINTGQEYGLALSYTGEKIRGEIMGIAGNFQVRPDAYRERGYSAFMEYSVADKLGIGASSLITHADVDINLATPLWRQAHGLFARWAMVKSVVLLAESDFLLFSQPPTTKAAAQNNFGNASFLQLDIEPVQGLHFMPAGELSYNKAAQPGVTLAGWASMAWFFASHFDARIDGVFQSQESTSGRPFSTTLLAQLHVLL